LAKASVTIDSAMIDPTERSMPAVRITRNMPSASRPFMEFCFSTFMRFENLRKCSGCSA
jgi:hypothetical protein